MLGLHGGRDKTERPIWPTLGLHGWRDQTERPIATSLRAGRISHGVKNMPKARIIFCDGKRLVVSLAGGHERCDCALDQRTSLLWGGGLACVHFWVCFLCWLLRVTYVLRSGEGPPRSSPVFCARKLLQFGRRRLDGFGNKGAISAHEVRFINCATANRPPEGRSGNSQMHRSLFDEGRVASECWRCDRWFHVGS